MQQNKLKQFRHKLYQNLNKRSDSILDLVDALSCQTNCTSPVQLSLQPQFRREYPSVFSAIKNLALSNELLRQLTASTMPGLGDGQFHQLAVDVTACPRPEAYCLADRSYVYAGRGRHVVRGHQYSVVVYLPQVAAEEKTWVLPVAVNRASSEEDKELLGVEQLESILADDALLPAGELVILTGDTYYSKPEVLYRLAQQPQLVTLVRARADRVFYRQPTGGDRRRKYGERFVLHDEASWGKPDEVWTTEETTQRGETRSVEVQAWHDLLMRGKRKPEPLRMFQSPFTLVRVFVTKADGTPAYHRPLWLIAMGPRRHELRLAALYRSYNDRFREEHFFRFVKQRLLLTQYQTVYAQREEQWWRLAFLAYLQLWAARPLAEAHPNPWERHRPTTRTRARSPTIVQRDMGRLLAQLDPIAAPVKPRGKAPGRPPGYRPKRRQRQPVVRKRPKKQR